MEISHKVFETLDSLGNGLLQDGPAGDLIREHFPTASVVDLYAAGIGINPETGEITSISCQGKTIRLPKEPA